MKIENLSEAGQVSIPPLMQKTRKSLFTVSESGTFCDIDSNIPAWLPNNIPPSDFTEARIFDLTSHLNNQELIEEFGRVDYVLKEHTLTLGQIHYLITEHQQLLLKNGFANLFFVNAKGQLYIVNVKYEEDARQFTPYVYRIKNLYRSWSKGNKLFVRTRNGGNQS